MSYRTARSMDSSLLGPTVGEMRAFIEGIADDERLHITHDKGYGQLDPGAFHFRVSETANNRSAK